MILGALFALEVLGCGKGLYTRAGQFNDSGGGGGATDPVTGSSTGGTGSGAGGTGGTGASNSPDAYVPADSGQRNPDAKSDADQGITEYVSNGTGGLIRYGDATLTIPKDSIPTGGPYRVTLSLVTNEGAVTLTNSDGTKQRYGGTIGPIYSIIADFTLWEKASLTIHVIPDSSISPDRVGLAYIDEASKIWVTAPGSTYDSATDYVTGTVTNPWRKYYFAPVETCTREGQDGGTCHLGLKCKGEACQE